MSNIQQVADILFNAEQNSTAVSPIREIIGETDLELAYAVQEVNVQRRIKSGDKVIGKKIGLTSPAVQKQLGRGGLWLEGVPFVPINHAIL